MSCSAQGSDTDKRTLEADDIAGACAAYPAGSSFPDDPRPKGCAVLPGQAQGASSTHLSLFALLSMLLCSRRRRDLRSDSVDAESARAQ